MNHPATNRTIFSGIQPTGRLTLGNYLGALGRFVDLQHTARCVFCVVDLHALTVEHDPKRLRQLTRETATIYLAAGLDPAVCVLTRQSDLSAHTELMYLLESTAYVGELNRMIQFKEKGRGRPRTRVSLYTYPVLMAADILLYGSTEVPVGEDQRQHVELARDLAIRFNRVYGPTFVVPEMSPATVGARVMDLQNPTAKMSKDAPADSLGSIRLLDPPEVVVRKISRAVTDASPDVGYDPENRPGVSNLLEILAGCTGEADPAALAGKYDGYAALKRDTADAVVSILEPLQNSYAELAADPAHVDATLRLGAERARELAAPTLAAARTAIGL
ncbi:tryptophan--tRNA ligase [Actinopolymorpha singaporensis]|uniref:Tryptophan--tRNA ligase n=1 Tax=Actinopolymorpha singaporensis TaxID=117157 RepID=A0A1H1QMI1_9ACTN|nr:tryptophan--tRNA ligase [Actinopolymorpha singaporensis]SDS24662.1 tryptophanyl-tRNA synthetase [Actinopolymorpha singaporensis]